MLPTQLASDGDCRTRTWRSLSWGSTGTPSRTSRRQSGEANSWANLHRRKN